MFERPMSFSGVPKLSPLANALSRGARRWNTTFKRGTAFVWAFSVALLHDGAFHDGEHYALAHAR
jgi:hypothetical protein